MKSRNIGVGLSVEQHLVSGERVLARCGKFHLTERRLLKYEGGRVLFLPVDRITTLNTATIYIMPAIILGGILLGMGIMAKVFGVMGDALSAGLGGTMEQVGAEYTATNYSAVADPIFIVLTVVGIIALVAGIALKRNCYQIKAPGLTKEDTKAWRIPRDDSIDVRNFIRMLETRMAGGGAEEVQKT